MCPKMEVLNEQNKEQLSPRHDWNLPLRSVFVSFAPGQSFLAFAGGPYFMHKAGYFRAFWKTALYPLPLFKNWSVIALQCCVSFRCAMKWISHVYTDPLPLGPPSHFPYPSPQVITEHQAGLPVLEEAGSHQLSVLHMAVCICQPQSPKSSHPPFPSLCPHACSLGLWLCSCPANRFMWTIFLGLHVCIKIPCLFFSFWLPSLCMAGSRSVHNCTTTFTFERYTWWLPPSEVKSLSHVRLFAAPWTVVYHTPLSMGFSRQGYWSGLPK